MLGVASFLAIRHFGEIEHFVQLVRDAQPSWLVVAFLVQAATYLSAAAVWFFALRRAGVACPLLPLVRLGVAKLFSDQALPSGGMSGNALVIASLNRRGVPTRVCMGVLQLNLVAYHAAYLVAAIVAVALLSAHQAIPHWVGVIAAVFCIFIVGVPVAALWLRRVGRDRQPGFVRRVPGLSRLVDAYSTAPRELLRDRGLVVTTILLHGSIFVLDAATLWVMLRAAGQHATYGAAFASFMLASMVATVGPIPAGIGTFEATCVAILRMAGVPFEPALAATLLLRGFTLWLPMLPGLWIARRELRHDGVPQ